MHTKKHQKNDTARFKQRQDEAYRRVLKQAEYRSQRTVRVQHLPEVVIVPGDVAKRPQRLFLEARVGCRQEAYELWRCFKDCPSVAGAAAGDVGQTPSWHRIEADQSLSLGICSKSA